MHSTVVDEYQNLSLLPHPFDRLALVTQRYDDRNTVGQEWLFIVLMIQSKLDKSKIR